MVWKAVHEINALTNSKNVEKLGALKLKNVLTSKIDYFSENNVHDDSC